MNKKLSKDISKIILVSTVISCILLIISNNILSAAKLPSKGELDSVKSEMNKCGSDTCRFHVLNRLYLKHRSSGNKDAERYYGYLAYYAIKNSNSLTDLSDGYNIKAILLYEEDKLDSAQYFMTKALDLSLKTGYNFRTAWSYFGLGVLADKHGNSRLAINNFLKSKQWFLKVKDPAVPNEKINQFLADSYKKLNDFDSAITYLQYNIKISEKNSDTKSIIFILLDISECYKIQNNIKKSAEYLYNALKTAELLKDNDAFTSVYMKTGDFFLDRKKNYKIARSYYYKALEFTKKSSTKKSTAYLYGQIAKAYLEEGKDSLAMEYNLKSLKISEEINYRHSLSDSYLHLGYAYKRLGNDTKALENFLKCWKTQCDFCPPIFFHEALIGIADINFKKNNLQEALSWYKRSLDLADSSKAKAEAVKSRFRIGDYYRKINQYSLAENEYLQSLQIAKEIKNLSLIKEIADTLSNYYQFRNNFKDALKYFQLARTMDDSLSRAEQQASMANLEMNFEFEKLNKDNEAKTIKSNEEIKRQRVYLYFLVLISLLLTFLGVVIYISYKRKKNDNNLLTIRKREIEEKNLEIQTQIDEITLQKNEIERISKQLHEADQMKLGFFTNISHELRTPLTLIISPLIKLIKNTDDEETKKLYSLMYRNARKLQNLIDRLLAISKIDKGELKLNLKMNNLNKLVRVIASMFQSISEEKNLEFSIIEKSENIIFCFDAEQIEQVINNLLSNAFKFTKNDGRIVVEIEVCDENRNTLTVNEIISYAKITIKDNGIGIPPESIDKVFERFYQCDSAITRNFEGSGIGLALSKELVGLHKGTISAKSEPGNWTEFTVILPMVMNDDEQVINEYTPQKNTDDLLDYEVIDREYTTQKQLDTILVVEDNSDLRTYLKECLSKEFNVLTACTGTEGMESAKNNIPDIIISDVMMPETDGYQLTCMLKENIHTSHIPIILLTAKAGRDSKLEGLGKGADDYIIKPFDEDELKLKIRNILQNRKRLQERYRKQIIVNPSEIEVKSLDEQLLVNLTRIIEQEISNPGLDVEFLCEKIGLSRPQLYRKLKALTDLSINQFIRSIRLKRAAQLLEKKSATISEIAYMTGFENLSYFTKKFKEEFGKLPSEY